MDSNHMEFICKHGLIDEGPLQIDHDYSKVPNPNYCIAILDYKRVAITYIARFVVKKLEKNNLVKNALNLWGVLTTNSRSIIL
uniref:DNA transposase THAP9like [Danio rerio] n=1 Tax=Lepeophtheirus salmonis TaxID=72036 RepID=A0A0K2UWL8_LEPSM